MYYMYIFKRFSTDLEAWILFSAKTVLHELPFTIVQYAYFTGLEATSALSLTWGGNWSHLKCKLQLNPPTTNGDDWISMVSEFIISIIGVTTVFGASLILVSNGWSQSTLTSQWLSRKTNTCKESWNTAQRGCCTLKKNKSPF